MSFILSPVNEELAHALMAVDVSRAQAALKQGASPLRVDAFLLEKGQGGCLSALLHGLVTREQAFQFDLARRHQAGEAVDIKAELAGHNTPLRDAALGLIKALFKADSTLLLTNRVRGLTPLQESAFLGWGRLVSLLLKNGADPNDTNAYGRNAAHFAALEGNTDTLKRLSTGGIDLDTQDQDGQSPAHLAAQNEHLAAMRTLKQLGASFSLLNVKEQTPAQVLSRHEPSVQHEWARWESAFDARKDSQPVVSPPGRRGPRR